MLKKEVFQGEALLLSKEEIASLITLGGDPEFEIYDEDGPVRAIDVLEEIYDLSYDELLHTPIGVDGSGDSVELRPRESTDPETYVRRVQALLMELEDSLRGWGYWISARGDKYPLGGHIHIGSHDGDVVDAIVYNRREIVSLLDTFIGWTLETSGPARGSYALRRAYEEKDWGFEYRTPPVSIYHHPKMVEITYKLVKGLVVELLSTPKVEVVINQKTGRPVFKEYTRFLTPAEARYFLTFSKRWQASREMDYEAWGLIPRPPRLTVVFNDDWLDERKEYFRSRILELFLGPRKMDLTIELYGLKRSRGFVFALPTAPNNLCLSEPPKDPHPYRGRVVVGLPWEVRMDEGFNLKEVEPFFDWLVDYLHEL